MAILTQGTQLYFINPDSDGVEVVGCATSLNGGGNPADQIETTCLESFDREYKPGLRTPGSATFGINTDTMEVSHLLLDDISQRNPSPTLHWAIGWSDGTSPPTTTTDSSGEIVFDTPDDRSWILFDGYISDFPFDFQLNTVVTSEISIQRTGPRQLIPKVGS